MVRWPLLRRIASYGSVGFTSWPGDGGVIVARVAANGSSISATWLCQQAVAQSRQRGQAVAAGPRQALVAMCIFVNWRTKSTIGVNVGKNARRIARLHDQPSPRKARDCDAKKSRRRASAAAIS